MPHLKIILLGCLTTAVMSACATQATTYQRWGQQINSAPKNHLGKADVSRILGISPDHCESIPGKPIVGMLFRHDSGTTILDIYPDSPAAGTGIKVGDKILAINSKPVHSMEEIIASTEGIEGPHPTITIKTQRGSYVIAPNYSTPSEQCSWQITPEPTGLGKTNPEQNHPTSQRFFHATCRFTAGKAYICHVHWQE